MSRTRCSADAGPPQQSILATVPGQQRTANALRCARDTRGRAAALAAFFRSPPRKRGSRTIRSRLTRGPGSPLSRGRTAGWIVRRACSARCAAQMRDRRSNRSSRRSRVCSAPL